MKYVVRSITSDSYYCGALRCYNDDSKVRHYNVYWSQRKEDAIFFVSRQFADSCLVFLHGVMDSEEELTIEEVEE